MFGADDVITPWAKRAWEILQRPPGAAVLTAWLNRSLPLQPCLCDAWHDHVLFDGDVVAGLIDFGSVKRDNVAVDLARLLGSLVGNNRQQWAIGLSAYERVRRLSLIEEELVDILDISGTWLGAANWLKWLYHERRHYDDRDAVARRLAALVERMEHHPV
jgi:Ser/Thr protein kinase RdoA (MazF antagonist)